MGIEPTWLAWKARALPLSYARNIPKDIIKNGGERWIRTTEGIRRQIYSLLHLAALVSHHLKSMSQSLKLAMGLEPATC